MPILATCEGCFKEYNVPDNRAGQAFKCKDCGEVVRVPRPGAQPEDHQSVSSAKPRSKSSSKKKKKKRSAKSNDNGMMIGIVVGAVALIGMIVYLVIPKGDDAPAGGDVAGVNSADGSATPEGGASSLPTLSADEQALVADFRQMVRGLTNSSAEERKAANEKFAADHNMSVSDVLAVLKKDRALRDEAKKVVGKWQPLQIGAVTAASWPTQVNISIPSTYGGAIVSVPELRTPYLLTSVTVSGGVERHVFDLSSSREIGHWTNPIVAGHTEQLSPDGQLVYLQGDNTLQIVDAKSGQTVQQISSPDLHYVSYIEFIGPKRLMVLTPRTAQRTSDKLQRCLIFDATTGQEVSRFEREFSFAGAEKMSISPDGRYFLARGKEKSIEVVDLTTGEQLCALDLKDEGIPYGQIHSVAFSPDGRMIAVLEEKPLVALRLYIIDSASGMVALKTDLYGGTTSLGAPLELQLTDPLIWFPDGRNLLIGNIVAVDTATGRRVWQARGQQSGNQTARLPTNGGLIYQVNTKETTQLVMLPIDFSRIASTQAAWPSDAALSPGTPVSIAVNLAAGGLQDVNEVVKSGLQLKLERLGFEVVDGADRVLNVGIQEGSVAFKWTNGGDTLWESVATADTAMVAQLGHLKGHPPEQAIGMEGVIKVQAYPIPYFIAGDRQWTLPIIDQINHKG